MPYHDIVIHDSSDGERIEISTFCMGQLPAIQDVILERPSGNDVSFNKEAA